MQNMHKSSQQLIKEANLKLVFGLISEKTSVSRADIKKITKLSATTVSSLVEELLGKNLVTEVGIKEATTSGRKAILLNVNASGGYFAGIEITSTDIILDIYDLCFQRKLHKENAIEDMKLLPEKIVEILKNEAENFCLFGITIGIPAIINLADNSVISSTVVDIDKNVNICRTVAAAFPDIDVYLMNTSGLIAYAEKEFGENAGALNLVSVDINDGVGAGVIIEGGIYGGSGGMACEFGHVSVDFNGEKCKCGSYGCLEMYVSIPAILKKAALKLNMKKISVSELILLLNEGNKIAEEVMQETAKALSFGINNLVNIIDPEVIVIGGKVCRFGDYLLNPIKKYIKMLSISDNTADVIYSSLGDEAVCKGGAKYAFDRYFAR